MSRRVTSIRGPVRGPASALTDYLRETGITPTTIARRVATQTQPAAGPSTTAADTEDTEGGAEASTAPAAGTPSRRRGRAQASGYASDALDEPESPPKKQKLTKAAQAKLKAKAKKTAEDAEDSDEDAYTALSKSMWSNVNSPARPPAGSFEKCAKCTKQFTVTKYTIASQDPPGFLCHQCAKSSGTDPFKKPAAPKRRKAPVEKRQVTHFVARRFPTLVNLCVQVVSRNIDDIEAFGDIGALNMEAISKAISKNRSLTSENATLFYGAEITTLTLYDATKLTPTAFVTLGHLNPNLTTLRLDFCGLISDDVFASWSTSLPNLTSLQLLGPFLVRPPAWISFFKSHPQLSAFLITQSPRFDVDCVSALVEHCALKKLRLREVGKMSDEFLEVIQGLTQLEELDISEPAESCTTEAVVELLSTIGQTLTRLNLSLHVELDDEVLDGLKSSVTDLSTLSLSGLPLLTNEGVTSLFEEWVGKNPPLLELDLSRNTTLSTSALLAVLNHSGATLTHLNINGWKEVENDGLMQIGKLARDLRTIDLGWCREVDDFVVNALIQDSKGFLKDIKVWGCNRVEGKWAALDKKRASGVRVYGIETEAL